MASRIRRGQLVAALGALAAVAGWVGFVSAAEPVSLTRGVSGWVEAPFRAASPSRIDYRTLDARITRLMRDPSMVGLGVAIIDNGQIGFVKGYGTTTAAGTEPVGVHTVFRWASLSKGVAATMVGELAGDGRLSLEDPVNRYSATLKLPLGNESRTTIDDLLSHRVGITRNAYDNRLEAGLDPRVLRTQLAALKPLCAPGQCHAYQNVAFDAASEIVERVTGRPYAQMVERRLFQPLGMVDATVSRAGLMSARSWARPHVGRTTVAVKDNYYRVPAAGGVNSSIFDMARWMQAQMGEQPAIVPQRVLDMIHSPRIVTDRHRGLFNRTMGVNEYALGWRDYNYLGHRLIGHQGAVQGYRATILFDPVKQSGIALLWNSQSARPVGIQLEMLDMLYGLPRQDWMGLAPKPGADAAPAEVE